MDVREFFITLKNVLFKCFFVGVFFLILAAVLYFPCKCFLAELYQNWFGINSEAYYNMWASFVGLIKTILIFLFLVPAIAIHFTVCKCEKND